MSERDIQGNFSRSEILPRKMVGADLSEKEKQTAQMLVDVGLNLLEGLFIDINKIADATQYLASHQKP